MVTALAREELRRAAVGRPTAVTIGVFDGVHRGHQALLRRVIAIAGADGLASGVVTFHPHPRHVIAPDTDRVHYLTSLEDRIDLILGLGVDCVAPITFTSELATTSAEDFVRALVEELEMRTLVVGPDFALGRQRGGDPETLRALGARLGFRVEMIDLVQDRDGKVSSTEIRSALAAGDLERVADLLGRPYSLHGPVVFGFERGQAIGFPTANLAVAPDRALPASGVYATLAHLPEGLAASVTNIGQRPTFDDGPHISVECHILDWNGDLYGEDLRIDVIRRLRAEEKFDSVDALVAQIRRDCDAAREVLTT